MSTPEYSQRLIIGSLLALGVVGIAYCLGLFYGLGVAAAVLFIVLQLAIKELCQLLSRRGALETQKIAPLFIGIFFIALCRGFGWENWHRIAPLCHLGLFITFFLFTANALWCSDHALVDITALIMCGIYLALPLAALYNLINDCGADYPLRQWWAIYAISVTKMTDVGAWFFGKIWGRSPLGSVSPHKTIEGIWGGLLSGCLTGTIICCYHPHLEFHWQTLCMWTLFHFCVSAIGQVGDLVESLLKRAVNARHSGTLPGLGGMLDLLDSLLLTAPFLYLWHRI